MTPMTARTMLVACLVFACVGAGFWAHAFWTSTRQAPVAHAPSPINTADALQAAFVSVAERVRPAVVHIGTVQVAKGQRPQIAPGPFAQDPFFKDFFDQFFGKTPGGPRSEFRQPGLGSGVIIDKRGYVLTNFHVIRGSDTVTVRLSSKQEYPGRTVGADPKTDLAVVRFEPDPQHTVATPGNSHALPRGETAIAIGNPFGLDQTVTLRVGRATGR